MKRTRMPGVSRKCVLRSAARKGYQSLQTGRFAKIKGLLLWFVEDPQQTYLSTTTEVQQLKASELSQDKGVSVTVFKAR